jgi:hypothetical protein
LFSRECEHILSAREREGHSILTDDHPACPRQIFTERLPTVAAPWARRTLRLAQLLLAYGLALGGEAGARLVARLGLRPSPDTLLRLAQAAPAPTASAKARAWW